MNMDSAETTKYLNAPVASPSSTIETHPSESSPSTISEQSSTIGTISTKEFINKIIQEILEISLLEVRKNKDKKETENDHG